MQSPAPQITMIPPPPDPPPPSPTWMLQKVVPCCSNVLCWCLVPEQHCHAMELLFWCFYAGTTLAWVPYAVQLTPSSRRPGRCHNTQGGQSHIVVLAFHDVLTLCGSLKQTEGVLMPPLICSFSQNAGIIARRHVGTPWWCYQCSGANMCWISMVRTPLEPQGTP